MDRRIRLSVATNFQPELLAALDDYPVFELFGKLPSDKIGGGRASFTLAPTSAARFKSHVASAWEKGIGFNYLINPACMDNREYTRQGQAELNETLDFVAGCGINCVTVSLPFLLPIIKRRYPRLKVRVGVYARVDSVAKARFWEDAGADCITLESISVNRDFGLLAAIRKAVKLDLQLIVNSNCMMFCPLSGHHMVNLAHASQKGHRSRGFMIDYCVLKCSHEKLRDPSNYLRSEFIRPEDLKDYVEMGFTSFKVLERGAPTDVMAARVKAYSEGRFDGNLLDLIQPYGYKQKSDLTSGGMLNFWKYFFRPELARLSGLKKLKKLAERRGMLAPLAGDPVYIDNRKLDGFLAGLKDKDCRNTDCARCGYCAAWTAKAVSIDEAYRSELLRLYGEAFSDMHSGVTLGV